MDGFSPYYQDLIFSRLSQHLHPKHGRLYIVGLNPIPDKVDGDGQIICEVTKLRDACILLAGKITVMLCRLVMGLVTRVHAFCVRVPVRWYLTWFCSSSRHEYLGHSKCNICHINILLGSALSTFLTCSATVLYH